jgi:hypothetical protein
LIILGSFAQEDKMFGEIMDVIKRQYQGKAKSVSQGGNIFGKIIDKIRGLLGGKAISDVDLMAVLEKKAEGRGLNWKISVVDFLTLLGINSSRANRDALAAELGVSPELKSGSAAKNEALRKAVFKKLAENGGNIPASLLD